MAKYISSGLIPFIRGSVGDHCFGYWRGIPFIRSKPRRKRKSRRKYFSNPHNRKSAEALFVLQYTWKNMDFTKRALWALYTKRYTKMKTRCNDGLCNHIGNKMAPYHAFISVNLLLIASGFRPVDKPPLSSIDKPPCPSTDLRDSQVHENKVDFYLWLSHPYPTDCSAQIWVKAPYISPYISQIVKLSTENSKTLVTIDKVKTKVKKKTVLKKLEDIEICDLFIQLRTVAANGEFSMGSTIYKLRLKSTKLTHKTPKRVLDFFRKYY